MRNCNECGVEDECGGFAKECPHLEWHDVILRQESYFDYWFDCWCPAGALGIWDEVKG